MNNAVYILNERAIKVVSGFLSFYFLTLFFGADELGYYSFIMSLSYSFALLSYFGFDQLYPKYFAAKDITIHQSIFIKLFISILFIIVFWIISKSYDKVDNYFLLFLSAAIFFNINSLIFAYFNNEGNVKELFYITVFVFIVSLLLKILSFYVFNKILLFFAFFIDSFGSFVLFLFKIGVAPRGWMENILKPSVSFIMRNKGGIFIVFMTTLVIQFNIRVDSYILSIYKDGIELSNYSLALKFNEVFAVLISSIIASFLPVVYKCESSKSALVIVKKVIIILLSLTLLSTILIYYIVGDLIVLIFGQDYELAGELLIFLVFSSFFGGASSIIGVFFIFLKKELSRLYRVMMITISNVVLCLVFVEKYGAYGIAISSVISSLVFGLLFNIFLKELKADNYK